MFKPPKYRKFLDPWKINIYAWPAPPVGISDAAFRTAMTEAYWLMSLAIDQATAARMRRQSRVGVAGATSKAELKAMELVQRRRDEILWLLSGLMGLHLPGENAAAMKRAEELVALAIKRSQEAQSKARLTQVIQTRRGGFPAPIPRRNASKRSR